MGVFAVGYAFAGVVLRGKALRAMIPWFILQFFSMGALGYFYPDKPQGAGAAADSLSRLHFDGCAIMVCVALGYAGFVSAFVSEARRYIKSQAEKLRLEGEMTAAREVQRVMVPEALPAIPGYAIESVYRPAAAVGGDFFQVISLPGGRSLAVIGDVSGKGLQAAMIVSMIVGILSIISAASEEPAEILAELNRRLYRRMSGGFATCLAARLDPDGQLTVATAGHPAPYLNGREVSLPGSMPLGMSDSESYSQTTLGMRAGDVAVLLTDGVPEASNTDGELFGFARVESLLRGGASAVTLADAAQQHGQNDDLTVIAISRRG
jgi:serine phosphatase RsbU (regulator of sigma subunit)